MSIASRLREARERTGLNQAQAAERVGIDASTLSWYEGGQRKIPAATLLKLCRLYGLSPTTLLPIPNQKEGQSPWGISSGCRCSRAGECWKITTEVSLVPISWLDPMEPEPPFFYRLKTSPIPAVPHNATLWSTRTWKSTEVISSSPPFRDRSPSGSS
jgi:transcriptional regulator with XRE-family HTH domain